MSSSDAHLRSGAGIIPGGIGHFADLDAVIMCLDRGHLLHPLAETIPTALLPLANQPLIAYQLFQLANAGCKGSENHDYNYGSLTLFD